MTKNKAYSNMRTIPKTIWALGFVSLFMDTSSELIHSLLPVFLVSVLGASVATVGVIEGVAEASASITKVFSGFLSDYFRKRKLIITLGYGLAAISKPLFALAGSIGLIFAARFIDRIGKGVRGAPRDALIGDITPPGMRGASYGLRQSLDTLGAVAGPLLAVALMAVFANDIRAVFWVATIPAFLAIVILVFGVKDAGVKSDETLPSPTIRTKDLRRLNRDYWRVLTLATALTLARFSEAFLLLRAENLGLTVNNVPFIFALMNIVYAISAYPSGLLSDRIGRRGLIVAGCASLIAADVTLALAHNILAVLAGVVFWGLHMGLTQGLFAALVTDTAQPNMRGTAFGIFHFATGVGALVASLLAGVLWDMIGPAATFWGGAIFASIAMSGFVFTFNSTQTPHRT